MAFRGHHSGNRSAGNEHVHMRSRKQGGGSEVPETRTKI